jgi:hypothetical protein
MLVNPYDAWAEPESANTQAAARAVGQQLVILKASTKHDIDEASMRGPTSIIPRVSRKRQPIVRQECPTHELHRRTALADPPPFHV